VNINANCGSTHPESLQAAVLAGRADLGLAFDGDADRMLAVDHTGALVDGDQLMAMMSLDLRDRGLLAKDTVVVTVMTNLGFKLAMAAHGVRVAETKVGDRYVLEEIEKHGYSLGGEQSGHLILRDHASTGDGILSGMVIADLVRRSGRCLADLASVMTRLPQVLRNVKGVDRARLSDASVLWAEVDAVEDSFAGSGRVLIRPSGTESLVRVMVEAPTQAAADAACARLCATVERELAFG
jgi:phosphoglucosamine mutase